MMQFCPSVCHYNLVICTPMGHETYCRCLYATGCGVYHGLPAMLQDLLKIIHKIISLC